MNAKKNAELYDAMLYSLEQNGIITPLELDNSTKKSIAIDKNGCILTIDEDAVISQYKILPGGKTQRIMTNDDTPDKLPVETAVFASPNYVIYSLKNKTSYLANIPNKTRIPLPVKTDYVRNASLSPDGSTCAVAYNNGSVAIVPTSGDPSGDKTKDFSQRLTDVYCAGNGIAYVLCHDGSLIKWDYARNKETRLLPRSTGKSAFKMTPIASRNRLAICYSDGNIQFIDLNTGKVAENKAAGHTKLENMLYDPKTGILALSSADKRILLYNTKDLNDTPITIEEHSLGKSKVKSMFFNDKGVLFALTDDNQLHFWDTDITTYANTLQSMYLSPLSQSERDMILGRDFSEK
jgi:WD40 repeat protein